MERRFNTVFDALHERKARGESFITILSDSTSDELIAALAVAGKVDPVAANAVATELLNRLRRGPFLGAFFVSITVLVLIYVLDFVYTGTFLLLESGARAHILVGISIGMAGFSALLLMAWAGAFRGLRSRFIGRRRAF